MSNGDLIVLPQIGPWAQAVGDQGFIYDSVTQFIIQPQRTKHLTKRNSLDELSETWIGPAAQEDQFVPDNGTPHPIYTMMTLLSVEVRRYVQNCGVVSQVTLNYHGKMLHTPSGTYVSKPTIDTFWSEGEVSWEENATISGAPVLAAGPVPYGSGIMGSGATGIPSQSVNQPVWTYPKVTGIQQWSRRYTGRNVRLGFITNARPSGDPGVPGYTVDLTPYLGFVLVYDVRGPFQQGNQSQFNSQSIVQQIICTDVNISDSADGWYQVNETYQSRMYVVG